MKTVHIAIAGAFALTGLLVFERNNVQTPTTVEEAGRVLSCISYDTVPNKPVYRDLNTGETIDIWYDKVGMRTLNKKTGGPVEFYVNASTNDTVLGRGRFVVNSYVVKGDDGKWKLDDGKVKVDGDELKVKVGDQKFKIDGDEINIKNKDGKVKYEEGKTKIKTKDTTRTRQ